MLAGAALGATEVAATGGTPTPTRSGGTVYGAAVTRPEARPIATTLKLAPTAITAGDALPRLRVRVRQRGIERVRARVVVLRLPRGRVVAQAKLGWVPTGTRLSVPLPAPAPLRAGRYLVRLHAVDSRGRVLLRSARRPGRARLVVHGRRAPVAPPAPPLPAPAAPAPSPGGPGVFPVAGPFDLGGDGARFGAGRSGHAHEGHDIMAAAGTPVVAPYAGVVARTTFQERGAGEYVVLDAIDGRDYFFAHCQRGSTAVAERAPVIAGQQLCRVGATGTTSGAPHLHFEIWNVGWRIDGGHPIDPLPELLAWSGR